eukprot:scaffold22586_cov138-Cylindrotheca_fusiformis.AAC.24
MWITDDQTLGDLDVASKNFTIECLYFVNVDFGEPVLQKLEVFRGRSLTKIVLHSCRGDVHDVISFFLRELKIENFVVNEVRLDTIAAAKVLGDGLCEATTLKSLHLQGIFASSHFVDALRYGLVQCPSLENLVFNNYVSTSYDGTAVLDTFLVEAIPRILNLKRLEVWSYKLEARSVQALLRSIHTHPSLVYLRVSMKSLEPSILSSIDLLSRCPNSKLRVLELSIHTSCDSLHKLPSKCGFVYNIDPVMSSDDVDYLGKTLFDNPRIASLDLSHKGLKDEGAIALASWLRKNANLKRLCIQGNPVQSAGAQALLSVMKSNVSIEDIDLPYDCECASSIEHYADLNKGGRKLLTDETFPLSLWPLVLERAVKIEYKPKGRNRGTIERRANVIYNLLHGPAGLHIAHYKTGAIS